MYRKDSEGWLKHADFIVLDLLCLQISFILAYVLSGYGWNPYHIMLYRNMSIFLELADLLVIFCYDTMKGVLKKGYYRDFVVTLKHSIMVGGLAILYLFLLQQGGDYSRLALFLTILLYTGITYFVRELRKKSLKKQMQNGGERSLLIITSGEVARRVVDNMKENNYARFRIAGVSVIDEDWIGRKVEDIPVVANEETTPKYVCKEWIDEVLIVISDDIPYPTELIRKLSETGVTIHLNLTKVTNIPGKKQFVEKVGVYTVLTTSINYASAFQLALKRMMDIAGGLVGCFLTVIIFLFVAPAIYIASPGPIFFSQERVGKNGRKFKIYKFRSMYIDAEERKAELMDENKLGDGKMFKMDFDPRVIGNKVLPDGTHKTGIGDFIRRTSLDEFPQFFNVLKGDMSIVGTRPPLISETNLYELHHRVRLAINKQTILYIKEVQHCMSNVLPVEDLSKTYLEHSMVINNFVIKIGSQIKDSLCRVFGDSVQYEWRENDDKVMIPDVSIICNLRDRKNISFTGIPRFVMEVLSNATEEYDRHEKMNIYCKVGVSEYWIVDWRKKSVEIYLFDFEEDGTGYPYLYKTVTAQNKEELQLVMFPNLKITFEELFDLGEY